MSRTTPQRRSPITIAVAAGLAIAVGGGAAVAASAPSDPPSSTAEQAAGETGFATGTDAVEAYLAALAAGDLDGAIDTFAVDHYVENFDLAAMLERTQAYGPYQTVLLPPGDPLNDAVNRESRRAEVAGMIANQYFALANPDFERIVTQPLPDDGAVGEFVASMTSAMTAEALAGLATHEFVGLADVDAEAAERAASEQAVANYDAWLAIIGADEAEELAVRTTLDSGSVTLLFSTVRYGDQWWIETLAGRFSQLLGVDTIAAGVVHDGNGDGGGDGSTVPASTG